MAGTFMPQKPAVLQIFKSCQQNAPRSIDVYISIQDSDPENVKAD